MARLNLRLWNTPIKYITPLVNVAWHKGNFKPKNGTEIKEETNKTFLL